LGVKVKLLRAASEALLVVGAGLAALLAVVCGLQIAMVPHTVANGRAINESFRAAAAYIERFQQNNGRLPPQAEFGTWKTTVSSHVHGTHNVELIVPGQLPEHAVRQLGLASSGNYALATWRGEWNEYYSPRVQASTVDSPLGLYASSVGLCLASVLVSSVLWLFARKVRRKSVKQLQRSMA
jgi:hypothetical protein